MLVTLVRRVGLLYSTEQFDLVSSGFCISAGRLDHLEG